MDFKNNTITIAEAKEIDLVHFLSALGYKPSIIRGLDYWFLSPLRSEKTASFKINQNLNCWYDHGIGKGGTLIDFGLLYYNCTIKELLQNLSSTASIQKTQEEQTEDPYSLSHKIKILKENPLSSPSLLAYLEHRRIPIEIAQQFCVEIRYALNTHSYYGIGFKNDLGGFEIRNPYFKASSSPKGITTIDNAADAVLVFEGFIDFLSFKAMDKAVATTNLNFVILNSVSFFEKARVFMEKHKSIRLYLDQDETGQSYTKHALSLSTKYTDESKLYHKYKDLNDWAMNSDTSEKRTIKQRLRY